MRSTYHLSIKVGRTLAPIHGGIRNLVVEGQSGWQGSQVHVQPLSV